MRILLVQPHKAPATIGGEDLFLFEPLALEYVAAGVADGHAVEILDMRLERDLGRTLAAHAPDVVGLTAYTVHVNTVRALAAQVKSWNPATLVVVGGHHATVSPRDFLDPAIDLVVQGEGVGAFAEILRRRAAGEGLDGMAGVLRAEGGELRGAPAEPVGDLDALPFPRRSLTARYRSHYFTEWMKPLASIRVSRGCPFRCNFCALWKLTGGRYLLREPESVVRELAEIREDYVFFADDESLVNARRMTELAKRIKAAGIRKRYFLYGRSDTIARHPELLAAWKEIGLERVFVGLEFFRDEDLRYVDKGSSVAENEKALEILRRLGIEVYPSFMIRPEFTREDFREFGRYCRRLRLDFVSFSVLTPLPGTDLWNQVEDRLITRNYDHFDFIHTLLPTCLPLREFYRELAGLYRRAVPARRSFSFLRRFPLREVPALLGRTVKMLGQVRNAYRDYAVTEA